MEKTSYYKAFVAQTPEEILRAVLKKKEAILIAISLKNGVYIEGTILDLTEESNHQKSVCMLSQDEQVSFFNTHNIALITVKQPKKMVVELSKGAVSRSITSANQELTVLQLKRWLNTEKRLFGSQLKEFSIDGIPLDQLNNRLNVQDVFAALKSAVDQITKDALGKEVWQGIETIVLQQADKLQLNHQAKTLTIAITIDKALPEKLSNILEEKLLQIL
ncbi:hypothetical protein CW731_08455 [Polaribacter sp. ALD11]|uniref:hypothetical protein n=1 Tax=Polaribacter sp. ALD11 TaxID=2058137 RepID=UPI000C3014F7|nr:hypothetical protein [Polaribacter sp. ALD11]AUC85318.1 hypothetical protein CW731_08455 [Polaribacter sp. ALD11]